MMITIKWKQVVFTGATILVLAACEKNILDQAPELDLDETKVFSDVLSAEQFVNDIYASLPNGYWPQITGTYAMEATITDEADQSYQWTGAEPFQKGSWNPTMGEITNEWNSSYAAIRKTNTVLENVHNAVDDRSGDDLTVDRLKGEALFLRAFFHFNLAKKFGGVPVITRVLSPSEDLAAANTRKSFKETIDQIVKDCDDATALLPPTYTSSSTGRITKGACMALKARALLYFASPLNTAHDATLWQNAANAAKAVIDLGVYSLYPNYQEIFTKTNNSEIIFSRQAGNDAFWDECNSPCGARFAGWGGTCPTQNFVDKYEMKTTGKPITNPLSGYDHTQPYLDRDPRFYASVLYNEATWAGLQIEVSPGGAELNNPTDFTRTNYYIKKFVWESSVNSGFNNPAFHNWPFLRLAEMYLNYAEALNEAAGPTAEVYNAVKAVRQRAGMPELPAGLSKDEMRDRIRNERAVELAFEEHRFWDVRRWKIAESTVGVPIKGMRITGTAPNWIYIPFDVEPRVFEAKMYLYPIPQEEINKNLGLTQNPGW